MASTLKIIEHSYYSMRSILKKVRKMEQVISPIFPCICDKIKAANRKYTSNEKKFYIFHAKVLKKLNDKGHRGY